ncbi:MAG: hypothetical protein IJA36_08520 [Lachnospiraceae bacterium]|nr:hypothetical protein [Lachnospiraceae bacterium]
MNIGRTKKNLQIYLMHVIQQIYDIKAANPQYGGIEIFEAIQKAKELEVM